MQDTELTLVPDIPSASLSISPVPELKDFTDRPEIWVIIRSLGMRNKVRRAAESVMQSPSERLLPLDELLQILLKPSGFRWKERALAAWILGMTAGSAGERE